MYTPLGQSQNNEVPQHIKDKIKVDDTSWIDELIEKGVINKLNSNYFDLLAQYDAVHSIVKMANDQKLSMKPNDLFTILKHPKTTRRMKRLLKDLYSIPNIPDFDNNNMDLVFKNVINFQFNNEIQERIIRNIVEKNNFQQIRLLTDNYIIHQHNQTRTEMDDIFYTPNMDPKIYKFLIERGIHSTAPTIPSFALERNMSDFIRELQTSYYFYLDPNVLNSSVVQNMVRNNSFDAIEYILDNSTDTQTPLIASILALCAKYNCENLLSMVLQKTGPNLRPGHGDQALHEASRLGRLKIVSLLLRIDIITLNAVRLAIEAAHNNGFQDVVDLIQSADLEGIAEAVEHKDASIIGSLPPSIPDRGFGRGTFGSFY